MKTSYLRNQIYEGCITICEDLERNRTVVRNGHHLAQKLTEKIITKIFPTQSSCCPKCKTPLHVRSSRKNKNGITKKYMRCNTCSYKQIQIIP
ncbi:MAG: hypothetical protein PHF86_09525 [Candidatus Nanoarchaeia archaeon]|jgi:hypothetical protein|nr:hypothetical protein [Candidatus Nanoarchaeia archaeon]